MARTPAQMKARKVSDREYAVLIWLGGKAGWDDHGHAVCDADGRWTILIRYAHAEAIHISDNNLPGLLASVRGYVDDVTSGKWDRDIREAEAAMSHLLAA